MECEGGELLGDGSDRCDVRLMIEMNGRVMLLSLFVFYTFM